MSERRELGPVPYKGVIAYRRVYYSGQGGLLSSAGEIGLFGNSSPYFNNILDIKFEDGDYVYYLDKERSPCPFPNDQIELDSLMENLIRALASLELVESRISLYPGSEDKVDEIFGYSNGTLFVDNIDQRFQPKWSDRILVAFYYKFSKRVSSEIKWKKVLAEMSSDASETYYQDLIKKLGISFTPPTKKSFVAGPYVHNVTPQKDFIDHLIKIGAGDYIAMGNECLRRVLSWTEGTVTPLQASVVHAICVFIFVHRYIGTRISSDVVINDYVIPGSGQMTQYKYLILLATGGVVD